MAEITGLAQGPRVLSLGMQVHRQTAASVVQHMALGVAGLGCEDARTHLLNYVWPNIFETSPHVVNAVQGAGACHRAQLHPPGASPSPEYHACMHDARDASSAWCVAPGATSGYAL